MKKKKYTEGSETAQKRLFKKTRGGIDLTEEQVQAINEGRKQLKKQMKKSKVYTKKQFELTASSMGLYFDKQKGLGWLLWFFHGRGLASLLAALIALLFVIFIFSFISQLRGHFTINLSDGMFKNGFVLSEDIEFTDVSSVLYSEPVENVPCISIKTIPEDVNEVDGNNSGKDYFAYTFYLRNEGEDTVDYTYELLINSEDLNLSCATWAMLFVEDEMTIFAEADENGNVQALPALNDNSKGYRDLPLMQKTANPEKQYQVVATSGSNTYYRILPENFETEEIITSGIREDIKPMEVHKYTVVLWLEGDDPDCTNDLIGGHLGVEMDFMLLDDEPEVEHKNDFFRAFDELRDVIQENLIFWED